MHGDELQRRSPVCTGLIAMMMTALMIGVVVVITTATMRTQDHLKIYNLPLVREEGQDTKRIAHDIGILFSNNDGGMFDDFDGAETAVVRYPEEPFEINGLLVFFLEAAPYFRQLPACKYYTAMNTGEQVEWCESIVSLRCTIDVKHTGFPKPIVFPDGKRSYTLNLMCGIGYVCCERGCCALTSAEWSYTFMRIALYTAPVVLTLIALRQFMRRNDPPPPPPRPSKAERLRRYREDLDDLIRRCYQEGRR